MDSSSCLVSDPSERLALNGTFSPFFTGGQTSLRCGCCCAFVHFGSGRTPLVHVSCLKAENKKRIGYFLDQSVGFLTEQQHPAHHYCQEFHLFQTESKLDVIMYNRKINS